MDEVHCCDRREGEGRVEIKMDDLGHWNCRRSGVGLDGPEEFKAGEVQFRVIEGVLELPQSMRDICLVVASHDSLAFFSASTAALLSCSKPVDWCIRQFDKQYSRWDPRAQGTLDILNFW